MRPDEDPAPQEGDDPSGRARIKRFRDAEEPEQVREVLRLERERGRDRFRSRHEEEEDDGGADEGGKDAACSDDDAIDHDRAL